MIREVKFESQDRRIKQILAALNENGIKDIEEANKICEEAGLDPYKTCEETQMICFENAKWAYVVGSAIALKKGCKNAADAAEAIGIGLQAFCIPGSVADDRKMYRTRKLGSPSAPRRDAVFRLLGRPRIFRCCRRCHQDCRNGQQSS